MTRGEIEADRSFQWSIYQEFCENVLRRRRTERDLTQAAMARMIGVERSRISKIERGLERPRDYPTAEAFAKFYGLNSGETFFWYRAVFGTPIEIDPFVPPSIIELINNKVMEINRARVKGDAEAGMHTLSEIYTLLEENGLSRPPFLYFIHERCTGLIATEASIISFYNRQFAKKPSEETTPKLLDGILMDIGNTLNLIPKG